MRAEPPQWYLQVESNWPSLSVMGLKLSVLKVLFQLLAEGFVFKKSSFFQQGINSGVKHAHASSVPYKCLLCFLVDGTARAELCPAAASPLPRVLSGACGCWRNTERYCRKGAWGGMSVVDLSLLEKQLSPIFFSGKLQMTDLNIDPSLTVMQEEGTYIPLLISGKLLRG